MNLGNKLMYQLQPYEVERRTFHERTTFYVIVLRDAHQRALSRTAAYNEYTSIHGRTIHTFHCPSVLPLYTASYNTDNNSHNEHLN